MPGGLACGIGALGLPEGLCDPPYGLQELLRRIEEGEIDTTFLISHRLPLEDAARGYKCFREEQDSWTKVILKPGMKQEQNA